MEIPQAHNEDLASIKERLDALLPELSRIRKQTGTPSVSFGVLHQGEVLYTHSEGIRDEEQQCPTDVNTMYLLGSLTKAFVASCCGILVDEEKLDWAQPVSTYIPFETVRDPIIGERATLRDLLSHTTGLAQLDLSWYGAGGETILDKGDLLHVVGHLPLANEFRAGYHYCNYTYALVGRIIESVGGKDAMEGWGSFLQKRILRPLNMTRSTTHRDLLPDRNFAEPHTVLDDGSPKRLPVPETSDQSTVGAAGAVWSSVPDMLIWAGAILNEINYRNKDQPLHPRGPLRQTKVITAPKYPLNEYSVNENAYGYGWARATLPSTVIGFLSTNGPLKRELLGQESRPRLTIYHGGQITGYLSSLYLFPETRSAVVVLANAQGLGDASDWTARAVIQTLFQLKPELDFVQLSAEKAAEQLAMYTELVAAYENNRVKATKSPPNKDLLGTYVCEDIKMTIDVFISNTEEFSKSGLSMIINNRHSQLHRLKHYHYDTFGFLPSSREEQQLRCLVDYFDWQQFLLVFDREHDHIVSLHWMMQVGVEPLYFLRQPGP